MRGRVVAALLACLALLGFIHFFRKSGYLKLSTSQPLALDLREMDVVNMKASLPEKVLTYLDLKSDSQQNYKTNCCAGIYLNVRTSLQTQERRLPVVVTTWMQTIPPNQIHLSTDIASATGSKWLNIVHRYGADIVTLKCGNGHDVQTLCCKSTRMWEQYYKARHQYKWYCHFDDDIYVNTKKLAEMLVSYDSSQKLYIGRWPHSKQLAMHLRKPKLAKLLNVQVNSSFRFATGGAYCISNSLMKKLQYHLRTEQSTFSAACTSGLTDDVALGLIVELVLGYRLTDAKLFNIHVNDQTQLTESELSQQITVSYLLHPLLKNVISLPNGKFDDNLDPTRFFSYHCLLYPDTAWCG